MVRPEVVMILTFTGASGTGKTSTVKRILAANSRARPLTSTTTRTPRPSDAPGEYEYICKDDFIELRKQEKFAWDTEVRGNFYGTRRILVDLMLDSRDLLALATLDQSGVETLQRLAKERGSARNVISLYFLSPGADILRERLRKRNEPESAVEKNIAMCLDWDDRARKSAAVFRFFQDDDSLDAKLGFALNALSDI